MQIDVTSLLLAMTLNLMTCSVALVAVMGRVNRPARRAQAGVALQTLGWILLLLSGLVAAGSWSDRLLSTLAMAGIGFGLAYGAVAFDLWCGRVAVAKAPTVLAAVMTVGYVIGFDNYPFRVGWANFLLTLQMALVVVSLCRRPLVKVGRWRWLLVASLAAQMVVTASRGVLGAFYTAEFPNFFAPHPTNLLFAMLGNVTAVMSVIGMLLAHRDEASRELERLASVDGVTGVLNRRAWMTRADTWLAEGVRLQQPLSVMMLDLDHFKEINDSRGHEAGDQALKLFAQAMESVGGDRNLVCRYGGEEFCVLKRGADLDAIRAYDQRLRDHLAEAGPRELGLALCYSAGVAMRVGDHDTVQDMLRRADSLLYSAKLMGRNQTLDERDMEII